MSGLIDKTVSTQLVTATGSDAVTPLIPYEQLLNQDRRWALSEGSLFFEGKGKVQQALRRITKRLNELGVPYAIAGAMAMFQHGYRRFTEDVDILVTREGLQQIHAALEGLGYVRLFAQSKALRDTDGGVKIDFLIAGQYPGDGKPKPVAFPDPAEAAVDVDAVRVLNLPTLVQLKIASGMSGAARRKDLGDAQELIKFFNLRESFVDQLHPYVQAVYRELWQEVEQQRGTTPLDE
jgi:hypothetical protein